MMVISWGFWQTSALIGARLRVQGRRRAQEKKVVESGGTYQIQLQPGTSILRIHPHIHPVALMAADEEIWKN